MEGEYCMKNLGLQMQRKSYANCALLDKNHKIVGLSARITT